VRFHLGRTVAIVVSMCAIAALVAGARASRGDAAAAASARLIKDLNPGVNSSSPIDLKVAGGAVYFQATDGTHGRELWKSDGKAAGTAMLKDINPAGDSLPSEFTVLNGALYFVANNGSSGVELWKSDGTAAGTVLVKDVNSNSGAGSTPANLVVLNNVLFFRL
jgi:ELWxxDGT repeat protein